MTFPWLRNSLFVHIPWLLAPLQLSKVSFAIPQQQCTFLAVSSAPAVTPVLAGVPLTARCFHRYLPEQVAIVLVH